jgi:hypothetical protein
MTTIWIEDQVSITNLAQHFEDCGKTRVTVRDERITLFTQTGLALAVTIDEDRKFLRISTYLPLDKSRSHADKLEYIQRLNHDLFLTNFFLDDDGDVIIYYFASYELGLIIGQFMIVLNRFGSLVEHIVENENREGLIVFGQNDDDAEPSAESGDVEQKSIADGTVTIDASRPKDAVLN